MTRKHFQKDTIWKRCSQTCDINELVSLNLIIFTQLTLDNKLLTEEML